MTDLRLSVVDEEEIIEFLRRNPASLAKIISRIPAEIAGGVGSEPAVFSAIIKHNPGLVAESYESQ